MYQYTQVQFVKRKGYCDVIVYYSKNGAKFRPFTGVKVDPKHILDSGNISSKHPNYEEDLAKIRQVQEKIENIVTAYKKQYEEKPSVDWLEREFNKPVLDARKDLQDMLCYWDEFIREKISTIRAEGTIKRYNNLKQNLDAFRTKKNYVLSFDNLDQEFFNDFLSYLLTEHEYVRNPYMRKANSSTLPEVGISNETAIKRMKDLVEYLKFCTVEFDMPLNMDKIRKYVKLSKHKLEVRSLSKTQKWELTLTTDEIQFTVNLDYYAPHFWTSLSENQKRYLDIIIFMCLQGTSPIDTKNIKRTDIRGGEIIKERSKTGNEFKVELDPISEEILERHDYDLNFTDQTLNDELKRMFVTIFELYRKHYEAHNEDEYQIICTQKMMKGDREILRIQHKGLFVELMTGRRSFITNLGEQADEIGIKETMDKVGHVRISTTLGYMHMRQGGKKKNNLFGITRFRK